MIEVRLDKGESEDDLRSLCDWLRDEPEIRRHANVTLVTGVPEPGGLGASVEAIQLIVDAGFQLANLALAFAAWKATRRNTSVVEVRVDGNRVEMQLPGTDGAG